jgi:hypothetical protein
MMGLMGIRAARDREQEQHESESSEGAPHPAAAPAGPQFTARGAVPPVNTDMSAAGPSASDRAFGGAAGIGAAAYTSGASPAFAGASPAPVGHEAAHVVQQRGGRVAKPVVEDEGLEHEADEMGSKASH